MKLCFLLKGNNYVRKQTNEIQGAGEAQVPIVSKIMDFSEELNCFFGWKEICSQTNKKIRGVGDGVPVISEIMDFSEEWNFVFFWKEIYS